MLIERCGEMKVDREKLDAGRGMRQPISAGALRTRHSSVFYWA